MPIYARRVRDPVSPEVVLPATKPMPVRDVEPTLPADPPPHGPPRRRRALPPAVVATAAVVTVGLASMVGTLTFGRDGTRTVTSGAATVSPTGSTDAITALGAQAGIAAADQPTAGPSSARPAPGRVAPKGTPTGTGAVGGAAQPAPSAAPPPAQARAQAAGAAQPSADATAEAAVLTLVNQERTKAGCAALSVDARLTAAARDHSAEMAGRGYFAHDTPDGVSVGTRVTNAGYRWSAVGENIAKGQQDAAAVMQAWMNSPGHRANILNCRFTNIGIGLARQDQTPLWTQDFGTPLG
jgi:uncharacterized protein YkwD